MQPCSLYLLLKSETFAIPIRFKHIMDFSLDIFNTLISSPNHSYHVKSDVCKEVFQSFVDYLVNDQIPDITINNINEYIELSGEFEILSSIIQAKKDEYGEYLIHINGLRFHRNSNSSEDEKSIAEQLDLYIEKYGESLMKIPIQSLYNIFNHPLRKLTKYDAAYELIKIEFSVSKNSSIFILLESLDGSQMARHNIEEMISLKNERNNFMAKIDFSFISKLQKEQILAEKRIESLEKQIKQLLQIIEQKNIEQKEKELGMFEKITKTIQKDFESRQSNTVNKIKEFENCMNELNGKLSDENNLLRSENEIMKKEIRQIRNDVDEIKKESENSIKRLSDENIQLQKDKEQIKKESENSIKKLSDENVQLKKDKEQIKKESENSIKKLSDENVQLKKDKEQMKKANITGIPLLFENNKEFQGIINYLINKGNIDNEINISSSPLCSDEENDSPKHAILYNSTKYFRTRDAENSFICFDFKNKRITPTAYTIKTASNQENYNSIRPRSWVVEVSNDNITYTIIDEQKNCESLKGFDRTQTFNIKNQITNKFRYIKLRQTEESWANGSIGNNILVICCIEFYGYLE